LLQTPIFSHPHGLLCGGYCVRFILEALGKKWNVGWSNVPYPSFPGRIEKMLLRNGQSARIERVSRSRRVRWLIHQCRKEKTIALFVRKGMPFPSHWIVVCGFKDGVFNIYDPSLRDKSAHDPAFPIGNTTWTSARIEQDWQAFPGMRSTSTAVIPV
jgi:hypothetical protein